MVGNRKQLGHTVVKEEPGNDQAVDCHRHVTRTTHKTVMLMCKL